MKRKRTRDRVEKERERERVILENQNEQNMFAQFLGKLGGYRLIVGGF